MKKSILALAVAATFAAPFAIQADTILYGSARVSVDYTDEDSINNDFQGQGNWDVANNDSRLGVQGSEDLGGGISAIYQYEFGVDVTEGGNLESNRPKFVGLKGSFGTLTIGTQETPYYQVVGITDIFNSSKTFGSSAWLGGSFGYILNAETNTRSGAASLTRLDNTILYATPDFNGFSASLMLGVSGTNSEASGWSDGIDLWNIGVKYVNGPFFAGATYIASNGDSFFATPEGERDRDYDLDQWAVGLGYTSGPFSVSFTYEQGTYNEWGLFKPSWRLNGLSTDTPWNAYLSGSYTFGNNVISAAYGQLDNGLSGQSSIDNYVVGYQYSFSKRTRLWVEYIGRSADRNEYYGDQNAVSIGTRVDF